MGMPDKVIAFDGLPKRFLEGFELCRADGFPRHWKEWLGKTEKITKIPPDKDFLTGAVRKYDPIVEEDYYFYMVDWTVNPVVEKWKELCEFVRTHVAKDVRLKEKIEDMALPLAPNKSDGINLEPEDVVVIPIPEEFQEKSVKMVLPPSHMTAPAPEPEWHKCEEPGCTYQAEGSYWKNSMRFHITKKHKKEVAQA